MIEITSDIVLKALRHMAWSRVKGELDAILDTYYGEQEEFETIDDFIERIEDIMG